MSPNDVAGGLEADCLLKANWALNSIAHWLINSPRALLYTSHVSVTMISR
jgi:hypothetical protein